MKKLKYFVVCGITLFCGAYFVCDRVEAKNNLAQKEVEKLADTLTYYKGFKEHFNSCLQDNYDDVLKDKELLNRIYATYEEKHNDLLNKENSIVEYASQLVQINDHDVPQGADDLVAQLIQGPHLVILDGAPGSGKSTTLAEAVKSIKSPIVCLGSTSSAAKGLFEDMQDTDATARIFAGISVDQFFNPQTKEEERIKKTVDNLTSIEEKIILMVDEAGLLNHDQTYRILKYVAENKAIKIILTGDSRQILPTEGIPFKLLTETLKGTPAYVTTSYIYRQWNFLDKMITSGLYNGFYSDKISINKTFGEQILNAGYSMTEGYAELPRVGEYYEKNKNVIEAINPMNYLKGTSTRNGDMTFRDYISQKYPNVKAKEAVEKYVEYLADNVETLVGTTDEDLKNKLDIGPTKDNYDSYIASALVLQQMGIRGYEVRGMLNQEKSGDDLTLLKSVAREFALNYGAPKKFKQGMLAITASEEVASKLNSLIREEMKKEKTLPKKEPVYVDGAKSLMSAEELAKLKVPYSYAYALDVITSQGMTIGGKVILVVTQADQTKMRGGEILVGSSRHRGLTNQFEIKLSAKADKDLFYKHSVLQQAGLKVVGNVFNPRLYQAAMGNTGDALTNENLEKSQAELERESQGFKDYLKANSCFMKK